MKRTHFLALAVLLLGGLGLFTSCSVDDNPYVPADSEAEANRSLLVTQIQRDAKTLAEQMDAKAFNVTAQAYAQLLALIERDKHFIPNIRALFSAAAEKKSLLNLYPVEVGSELAQMGYLAYITYDNGGFGARIVFDGKGGSSVHAADYLEFIFPANVTGIGTTLFKLTIRESDDCYQSVSVFNNLKRLACINRLPKQVTMTLNGFIDEQELTLSESVVGLQLPQDANSQYVNFDAGAFTIVGRQSAYLNTTDESTIDYRLAMEDSQLTLDYDYSHNGTNIIKSQLQMAMPQQVDFITQMAKNAYSLSDLKTVSITILDDLLLSGHIDDGANFAQSFANAVKNRQQATSATDLADMVESLNQSCHLQISCPQMTESESLKFALVEHDHLYTVEPALVNLYGDGLISLSQLVGQSTMDDINRPFDLSFTPVGNSASSTLKFYSVFMQMMPLSATTSR